MMQETEHYCHVYLGYRGPIRSRDDMTRIFELGKWMNRQNQGFEQDRVSVTALHLPDEETRFVHRMYFNSRRMKTLFEVEWGDIVVNDKFFDELEVWEDGPE